jgi:hypothetical protein
MLFNEFFQPNNKHICISYTSKPAKKVMKKAIETYSYVNEGSPEASVMRSCVLSDGSVSIRTYSKRVKSIKIKK